MYKRNTYFAYTLLLLLLLLSNRTSTAFKHFFKRMTCTNTKPAKMTCTIELGSCHLVYLTASQYRCCTTSQNSYSFELSGLRKTHNPPTVSVIHASVDFPIPIFNENLSSVRRNLCHCCGRYPVS